MNSQRKKSEAFAKAVKVINSCTTTSHILASFNYIENFRKLFKEETITKKLRQICSIKRTILNKEL